MTAKEAAAALAVSERTLWTWTNRGELPAFRNSRAVRYRPEDLAAFVASRTRAIARTGDGSNDSAVAPAATVANVTE
jgi:excisionase family DNA binding protein